MRPIFPLVVVVLCLIVGVKSQYPLTHAATIDLQSPDTPFPHNNGGSVVVDLYKRSLMKFAVNSSLITAAVIATISFPYWNASGVSISTTPDITLCNPSDPWMPATVLLTDVDCSGTSTTGLVNTGDSRMITTMTVGPADVVGNNLVVSISDLNLGQSIYFKDHTVSGSATLSFAFAPTVPTPTQPSATANSSNNNDSDASNVGMIAGASSAGFIVCIVLCLAVGCVLWRRRSASNRSSSNMLAMAERNESPQSTSQPAPHENQRATNTYTNLSKVKQASSEYTPMPVVQGETVSTSSVGGGQTSIQSKQSNNEYNDIKTAQSAPSTVVQPNHTHSGIKEGTKSPMPTTVPKNVPHSEHWQVFDIASLNATSETETLPARYIIDAEEIEFVKVIGHGSFGEVYKGRWRSGDVAIKQVRRDAVNEKSLAEFWAEAALIAKLRPHMNIVQFLGVCANPLCLVTEFLVGGNLRSYLDDKSKSISDELQRKWIRGIALGMLHLTYEGVVHRDLAARNVLLSEALEAKISDFGMSRELAEKGAQSQTEANVGPLRWMAPESILKKVYSEKTDVWSYGVTLIEILTRDKPYPNESVAVNAAVKVTQGVLKPTAPPGTPPEISQLLNAIFDFDANKRPKFQEINNRLM